MKTTKKSLFKEGVKVQKIIETDKVTGNVIKDILGELHSQAYIITFNVSGINKALLTDLNKTYELDPKLLIFMRLKYEVITELSSEINDVIFNQF